MKEFVDKHFWIINIIISAVSSLASCVVYYNDLELDVRNNIGNVIALLSAMLGVITLIFTILLYLKSQEKFNCAMANVGNSSEIYTYLCSIIVTNIIAMVVIISIGLLKTIETPWNYILVAGGTGTFCYSLMGLIYVLCWITYITTQIDKSDEDEADI